VGKQILSLGASSLLLFGSLQSVVTVECQDAAKQQTSAPTVRAPQPNGKETSLLPGQFILQDATPILLRLIRNVSSADAHVGDSVDFEVLEDVAVNGILVIPKGSVAVGTVTEVQSKRRMGRAGKLEIVLDYVRLADTDKAAIRAVKDAKGGSHVAGMTAGIVATGLLFFPVAPLFLLMHGNDITVPKGAALAAYVNGDARLESSKFRSVIAQTASPASQLWLLQSAHVVGDMREGFRKTCVMVSPNGDYHREERKQVPTGGRVAQLEWAPPRVFEAKLTQADLDALRAILATPELYSMNGVVGDSGSLRHKLVFDAQGAVRPHEDIEIVTIAVARSDEPQLFELADIRVARQQEPVSELLDWVKGTERRQQERLLASQATNCSSQIASGSSSVGGAPMATGMSFPKAIFAPEPQLPHDTPKPQPVAVEVLINPDGSVAKASVESRPNPDVAQSVLDTVQKWKFQPARLLGVPIADTMHLRVVEFQEK
jgi:TonB family protein